MEVLLRKLGCDRQMGHCLKSQPCGQRQDVSPGTSGGARHHPGTASEFRDNSTLGGKEKDSRCPLPDVPQTSLILAGVLGRCWCGVVWPGESGAFLLSLGGKPFKMAFPRSTVGDSRPPENTPESKGDGERRGRLRGGGYLTHAAGTRSPSCESNMVSVFDCGGHVLSV